MLHVALKTLSEERGLPVIVQGVDPGRVTRYWPEGRATKGKGRISSGKESKKAKIDIVGNSLASAGMTARGQGLPLLQHDPLVCQDNDERDNMPILKPSA